MRLALLQQDCSRWPQSGIDFNFDQIKRTPDSRKTHRYLLAAAAMGSDLSDAFLGPISSMDVTLEMRWN